jgi:hypothetical protein
MRTTTTIYHALKNENFHIYPLSVNDCRHGSGAIGYAPLLLRTSERNDGKSSDERV